MQAFTETICGWCWESERQKDENCLMGKILVLYLKYENGSRGGLHAHGQACQPAIQTENMRRMLQDGVFQHQVYSFFESFMCCSFPVPNLSTVRSSTDDVRDPTDWLDEKCPVIQGNDILVNRDLLLIVIV